MLERGFFINNRYEILSRVGAGGMSIKLRIIN